MTVRVLYQTIVFPHTDIHLKTLRDKQQCPVPTRDVPGEYSSTWSLFGVVWPSSEILAHLMLDFDIKGKKILEVGCGIALPSIILNSRNANITASDRHSSAHSFLEENVRINQGTEIPFAQESWQDLTDDLGEFDLIIGSDLLYDHGSAETLAHYLDHHAMPTCDIIIVDPGRGRQGKFRREMTNRGFSVLTSETEAADYLDAPFEGQILHCGRHIE